MERGWTDARRRQTISAGFLLVMLALLASAAGCRSDTPAVGGEPRANADGKDGPRLSFQDRSPDFGRVSANQPAEYRLAFRNTGGQQLQIGDIGLEPARPGG